MEASKYLPEYPIYEYKFLSQNNKEGDQLFKIDPHLEALGDIEWIVSEDPVVLVEIFSISVCTYDCAGCLSGLKGEIFVFDEFEKFVIFYDDDPSSVLNSHETIKLRGPQRCFIGDDLSTYARLKDGQGREISHGSSRYCYRTILNYYNRRICSIVRGQHGFAALHYTIFEDAVQAKLSFTLKAGLTLEAGLATHFEVDGSIKTRYSNFNYFSNYEKKYYQSTLLENELVEVGINVGEIKLLKSVVAVPLNASLIVFAKLRVLFQGEECESLDYEQTFDPSSEDVMD